MVLAANVLAVLALCIGATAMAHAAVYLHARSDAGWSTDASPCDADDAHEAPLPRLVLAETIASCWLALAALRPGRLPLGNAARARTAVLLVGPAWLPARALTVLGRRLARAGAMVDVARVSRRRSGRTLARVAARADALRRDHPHRPVTVVCYGGAAASARALSRLLPRVTLARMVLLGAPGASPGLEDSEVVTIRAADDPWQRRASRAADGPTVELVGVGHLGLLVAPHVAAVVHDACAPPASAAAGARG